MHKYKFDEHNDPYKYVSSINIHMAIIGAQGSLKCKLLSGTFMEASLRWCMGLPCASINNYQELVRKLVRQFASSGHQKMSIKSLLNNRQGPSESLRDYLAYFNYPTIKVVPLNQEMYVGAFQNGFKVGHLNESLSQKPELTLIEVVAKAECYIKGEESNVKKKSHDANEHVPSVESSHYSRNNSYPLPVKDKSILKRVGETMESFTSLNTHRESTWCEVSHL